MTLAQTTQTVINEGLTWWQLTLVVAPIWITALVLTAAAVVAFRSE